MKKHLVWIFSSFAILGCASSVKYNFPTPTIQNGGNPKIVDKRGLKEKKAEIMSTNKFSCWFGIYRIGDNQIEPSKIKLLSSFIEQNIGLAKLESLTVNRFEMFNNIQIGIKKTMSFGLNNTVPSEGQIRSGGCADAFALQNNPENKESVIILYDVEVNGKRFIGKKTQIEPEITRGGESVRSPSTKERIIKAILAVAKEAAT